MTINLPAWSSVAPYLDQALDLEPGARAVWLDALEATHAEAARGVRMFLAECDVLNANGFLAGSALPLTRLDILMPALVEVLRQGADKESGDWLQDTPDLGFSISPRHQQEGIAAGTILGPYRLLREIGLGGMSSVWLAERCDGHFNRQVALKLPFVGPHYAQIAERFKRERDILAALTHPNIARLYDAGIGASGQSYLAMEYVNGTALTRYCDSERLTVRQRLALFLQVLAAVEFAHTHLVLHRDLKPSNIQVTEEGRVVLLDFGIAKLLSPEACMESPPTEMAVSMLTPDYASPEHLAGSSLWTTSDVYSLGVVLFELLTGARPFGMQQLRRDIEEAILARDPPRPSQFALSEAIAAARNSTPRKLAQALKGDLDTIILKALKKAPAERYQSIDAFARDIANYLDNLPVSARPDGAWYRTQRFVSRHKWQVVGTLVTSLSIIIGAGTAVWQAQETAQQRDRALALASRNRAINDFTSMLIGEAASSDKPVTVKEMLSRSENLALAGTVGGSDDRAAVLETIAALHIAAGDPGKAMQVLERALTLAADAGDAGLKSRLTCLHAMVMGGDMGEIELAVSTINRELQRLESDPENASHCLAQLANISQRAADADGALRYATMALDRFRQGGLESPVEEAGLLGLVAFGYNEQGDSVLANHYYEIALQKYREAGRERSPEALVTTNNWALVSSAAGVPKRSLELYEQIFSTLMARAPEASPPAPLITNRARVLDSIGRFAQARSDYEWAQQLARQSKNIHFEGMVLTGLASLAQQSGDYAAAAAYLHQMEQLLGPALSANGTLMVRRALIQARIDLGGGKLDLARTQFDAVLSAAKKSKAKNSTMSGAYMGKAEADLLSGDAAAAVANARAALEIAVSMQGGVPNSTITGRASLMLGRALLAHGEAGPAHEAFEAAVLHLSNTIDADHPDLVRARELLIATPAS